MTTYPDPLEDKRDRDPEWEPVALADGQPPTMRTYEWDPITDSIRVTGPKIAADTTRTGQRLRPVP